MEGSTSVYQVNPVIRKTGERRAEFLRTRGAGFESRGSRGGGGGEAQSVRGNCCNPSRG